VAALTAAWEAVTEGCGTEIFEMKKRKCFFIIMQVSSNLADRKAL